MSVSAVQLIIVLLFQTLAAEGQGRGWRGITPLHSTRADVERVLGAPIDDLKSLYDTDKERILVFYQKARCPNADIKSRAAGWDVPIDTVLLLRVSLKAEVLFKDLHIDESKYEKFISPLDNTTYYTDREQGVSISVSSANGLVNNFSYSPTSKDERLRCPRA